MSFLGGGGAGGLIGHGGILIGAQTGGLRGQVRQGMRAVKQEFNSAARDIEGSGKRTGAAFGALANVAKMSFLGIAGIVGIGVGAAIQFESAWAGVRKTVDATPAELAKMRQGFRDLAKEIPTSVNELAAIGENAGALGIKKDDILEFTRVVALLGQTTNVTTEQASTALGQLSNVLKLSDKDYSRFASTLVDLGNKGASTESQILEIASRSGAGAALIGFSTDATLAWASSIASLGIEAEAGGSSLQNFFLKAQKLVNKKDGLQTLATVAGMTAKQFKKAFAEDASGALQAFVEGLGKLKSSDQLNVLDSLKLNDIRITRGLLGLANGGDLLAKNLGNAAAAWKANTAAEAEAEKRFETTASILALLKNQVQDYFISAGDAALPFLKGLLVLVRDKLPQAMKFLSGVWDRAIFPSLKKLGGAFGHLLESVGKLFGNDDAKGWADGASSAVEGLASAIGHLADMLAGVVDAFAWLLANPVVTWIARALLVLKGLSIMRGLAGGAVGALNGMSAGALRALGLGRLVGGSKAVDGPDAALKGAAGDLSASATALDRAAGKLGTAGGLGGAGGRGAYGIPAGPGNQSGRLSYAPDPAGSRRVGSTLVGPKGQLLAVGTSAMEREAYLLRPRTFDAFGKGIVRNVYARSMDAVTKAGRTVKSVASAGLGMVGKLFWPLTIASIGAELIKAPLGDLIAQNTQFKRVGAQMKEDFVGGVVSMVKAWAIGGDLFVALPKIQLGKTELNTEHLGNLNISDKLISDLKTGGVTGALAQQQIAPEVLKKLQRGANETVVNWYQRIREDLKANGIDTTSIDALIKKEANRPRARGSTGLPADVQSQITTAVTGAVGSLTSATLASVSVGLNQSVVSALKNLTSGRIPLSSIISLPGATYTELAKLLALNAAGAIDPRLLGVALSGILKKPTLAPPVKGGIKDRAQDESTTYRLKIHADVDKASIAEGNKALTSWLSQLTPDEKENRRLGIETLNYITKGVKDAGKDPAARTKFLKEINKALALTGQPPITWDQLINWQSELNEDTGEAARKKLAKLTKKWAIEAAVSGAPGGAQAFVEAWGKEIEAADTADEKEKLRKKLNKLIPGKADDISKKDFAKWLKSVQTQGEGDAKTSMAAKMVKFVGGLLKDPQKAIEQLAKDLGITMKDGIGDASGKPSVIQKLWQAGLDMVKAIGKGAKSSEADAAMTRAAQHAAKTFSRSFPASPVKEGPLKHPFLYKAGANIIKQVAAGMKTQQLQLGPMEFTAAASGHAGGQRPPIAINADKLQVFSRTDERSMTEAFGFLAQDGR